MKRTERDRRLGSKGSQKTHWRESDYIRENREHRDRKRILFASAEQDEIRWTACVEPNAPRPHKDGTKPQKQREFVAHVGDEHMTVLVTKIPYFWENNKLVPKNVEQNRLAFPKIAQPSSRRHAAPKWVVKKCVEKCSYYGDETTHVKVLTVVTTWVAK